MRSRFWLIVQIGALYWKKVVHSWIFMLYTCVVKARIALLFTHFYVVNHTSPFWVAIIVDDPTISRNFYFEFRICFRFQWQKGYGPCSEFLCWSAFLPVSKGSYPRNSIILGRRQISGIVRLCSQFRTFSTRVLSRLAKAACVILRFSRFCFMMAHMVLICCL